MAINLDDTKYRNDPSNTYIHIENFVEIASNSYNTSNKVALPSFYIKIKNVLLIGMGGSGIANDMISSILQEQTNLSVCYVHDYTIPKNVSEETLVIAASYSGNTEETIDAFEESQKRGARLIAISSGGKLEELASKYKSPFFRIDYKSEPRFAMPAMFASLISIFEKLNLLKDVNFEFTLSSLQKEMQKYLPQSKTSVNPAKLMALRMREKTVVIWADPQSQGIGIRLKQNLNENAKTFCFVEVLPEANHNAIQGLNQNKNIFVLMMESNFTNQRIILRQNITSEIFNNNKVNFDRVKFINSQNRIHELLIGSIFSDWVSFYLSQLYKQNPADIQNVEYLKSRL